MEEEIGGEEGVGSVEGIGGVEAVGIGGGVGGGVEVEVEGGSPALWMLCASLKSSSSSTASPRYVRHLVHLWVAYST